MPVLCVLYTFLILPDLQDIALLQLCDLLNLEHSISQVTDLFDQVFSERRDTLLKLVKTVRKVVFVIRLCVLALLGSCPLILLRCLLDIGNRRYIQQLPLVLARVEVDHGDFIQRGQLAPLRFCHLVDDFVEPLQDVVFGLQLTENDTV